MFRSKQLGEKIFRGDRNLINLCAYNKPMELFELIKVMFENPEEYANVTTGEKRKHFFMINRRMSIQFPLQAQVLQHQKVDEASVVDFWQNFVKQFKGKTPFWMYVSGTKKVKEAKEKVSFKDASLKSYASLYGLDPKSVREAADLFPDEMKKELAELEKMIKA